MMALSWVARLLAFLGIPTWIPLAGLAGVIAMGGAYVKGRMDAAQNCREAELRAVIASMQRDIAAGEQARSLEAAQTAELEAQRQKLEQEVAAYETALKTRPEPGCSLTADDVRALGGLHGKRKR